MNSQQERVLQSFRRVLGWHAANQQFVANGSASPPALAAHIEALNGVVERATNHAAEQETQAAQSLLISKDEREQRREVLSHHMGSIAKVARALRGDVPGIGVLQMPKGNIESAALITAATVMARKSEVYRSVLVENGLPTDFVEQLEGAAGQLKASLDARGRARGLRVGATRALETELGLGRRIIQIMDVTLTRVLRSDPGRLAEWQQVKRVTLRGSMPRLVEDRREVQPTGVNRSPTEVVGSPTGESRAA